MPIFCRMHWDTSFSRAVDKSLRQLKLYTSLYLFMIWQKRTRQSKGVRHISHVVELSLRCAVKSRETNYHQAARWNNTNWRAAASQPSERASESLSFLSLRRMKVNKSPWKKKFFISPVCVYLSRRHALNCRANREDKKLLAHCAGRMIVLLWSSKPLFL